MGTAATIQGAALLLLLLLAEGAEPQNQRLPDNFQLCKKDQDNLSDCVLKSFQAAMPELKATGVPEVGLQPLDPLLLSHVRLASSGSVAVDLELKGVRLGGLGAGRIVALKLDPEVPRLDFSAQVSELHLTGPYRVRGRVLLLPITGHGDCSVTLERPRAEVSMSGPLLERSGLHFWNVTAMRLRLTPQGMRIRLHDLFNGNRTLGDGMNKVLNENWEGVYRDLQPSIEMSFAELFRELANKVFLNIAMEHIFP